jgi:hypothetical protein
MRPVFGESTAVPVALAGGMFTGSAIYRGRFLGALSSLGIAPTPMALVSEPADGALRLAQRALTS